MFGVLLILRRAPAQSHFQPKDSLPHVVMRISALRFLVRANGFSVLWKRGKTPPWRTQRRGTDAA